MHRSTNRWTTSLGAWLIMFVSWSLSGLFVGLVWWISDFAYGVHWLFGFPVRLVGIISGLGWLISGVVILIVFPVAALYSMIHRGES